MTGIGELTRHSRALRGVFGLATLLGLFAMHGLATHGTAHDAHSSVPISAQRLVTQHDPDVSMSMGAAMELPGVSETPSAPGGGLLGLTGVCLAVLLVGVAVAVLRRRRVALTRDHDLARRSSGATFRARRDRDPPCLLALSIQRC